MIHWMPSFELVSQLAHFFAAAAVVLAAVYLWGWRPATACLAMLAFALVKEFGFDLAIEQDALWSSCVDFSTYLLGVAVTAWLVRRKELGAPRARER